MNRKVLLLCATILFLWLSISSTKAQVTVGSNQNPNKGALLDLKEKNPGSDNVTATKGLVLPRLILTDKNNLYPMFESDPDYLNNVGGKKNEEDVNHIGLTVYNLNKCLNDFAAGPYVWNGQQWQSLSNAVNMAVNLSLDHTTLDLPSGKDLRSLGPTLLTATWTPYVTNMTMSTPVATGVGAGAISFMSISPQSPYLKVPAVISFTPDELTEVTDANPWVSKESRVTFNVTNECGTISAIATLNQTNYALQLYHSIYKKTYSAEDFFFTMPLDGVARSFIVKGNAKWKGSIISDPKGILSGISTAAAVAPVSSISAGGERKNGTSIGANVYYTPISNLYGPTRYATAKILIEDEAIPKRFADLTVTGISCSGTIDYNETLSPGTYKGYDQENNPFFYRHFGSAGYWMTTNVRAKTYASDVSSPPVLTGPLTKSNNILEAAWGYPTISTATDHSERFNADPSIGLLYTWGAATAGKNEVLTDQGALNLPAPGTIQGICPNGWWLPNKQEWAELESEIMNNRTEYSNLTTTTSDEADIIAAMKSICSPYLATWASTNGLSNTVYNGGFDILLVGQISTNAAYYGDRATIWTSSSGAVSGSTPTVHIKEYTRTNTTKDRIYYRNNFLMSVRCKRNTAP